jgi:hypothetical protein
LGISRTDCLDQRGVVHLKPAHSTGRSVGLRQRVSLPLLPGTSRSLFQDSVLAANNSESGGLRGVSCSRLTRFYQSGQGSWKGSRGEKAVAKQATGHAWLDSARGTTIGKAGLVQDQASPMVVVTEEQSGPVAPRNGSVGWPDCEGSTNDVNVLDGQNRC